MSVFSILRRGETSKSIPWHAIESNDGLLLIRTPRELSRLLCNDHLNGFITQIEDEGLASLIEDGYQISWDGIYELLGHRDYSGSVELLGLPPVEDLQISLSSNNSLEDVDFSIAISGWHLNGQRLKDAVLIGAILSHEGVGRLLPIEVWKIIRAVQQFSARPKEGRTGNAHRQAWGRIRRLAVDAHARLDDFLHRTIVLSPEKLSIGIRRDDLGGDRVIEVIPGFEDAPDEWLRRFDLESSVKGRYDLPTADGVVQVLITPKVRTVLEEIKRFDHRRVAGSRAQAFILNPFAALGSDAADVIDEEQFEQARADAGIRYERFLPIFERDSFGYPLKVGLLIESASRTGPPISEKYWLNNDELPIFTQALKSAIDDGFQLLGWEGYDFELQGDASILLEQLTVALVARRNPPVVITYAQIHDLTHYASRVQEIGFETAYYSPYIAKKKEDEGWFPENIIPVIAWVPEGETEAIALPMSEEGRAALRQKVITAKANGLDEISVPGCPTPLPLREAERIIDTFVEVFEDAQEGRFDPSKPKSEPRRVVPKRKSPVVKANIRAIDYSEERREALSVACREARLPGALRADVVLLPHQRVGIAWLQALFEASVNFNCRGAVLADDMGLGKTLQLLTLMAWAIERDDRIAPMLVVAPVSLLENWKEEVDKFFTKNSLRVLTAYGDDLATLRVPKLSVDERLRNEDGLVKFLKPNWLGDARIVLTTYETLRDLEFSFAVQPWSIMVCDEAQKIKNPSAMVTRAAKKQNVGFKVACTGTPVENTLADLWCLFDFVQPGLLGALNDFGRRYRKPIEARTDEERARVEELRALIAPQILRRTKSEVAKDLPKKIVVEECRRLALSPNQRELYARAIELFRIRNDPGSASPFKNHLGLLHYLRLICTDPRRHGLDVFKPEPLKNYRVRAPKLDWLLMQLKKIREKEEKAIVFCEFRVIQQLLQHFIEEVFALRPDIINGDTTASANHMNSRQKRLRAFQDTPGFGVIILSPVAVGFGVNIQAANHVIHYTRTWNPAKEDQATDRAYRIGQTKDVYVYYPVVCADDFATFDVRLDEMLETKRHLAKDMLNGTGDIRPGEFKIEEVIPGGGATPLDEPVTLDHIRAMNWEHFEALACVLYARRGYDAYKTPAQDNGVDVVALARGESTGKLVQAKSSSIEGELLGWDAVKEVVAGQPYYQKQFPKVRFEKVCITNQFFNAHARMNASLHEVELIEQSNLGQLLAATPISMMDIERTLYAEWTQTS